MSVPGQARPMGASFGLSADSHQDFYNEWLARQFRKDNKATDIYSVPDSPPPPPVADCPFEYVDEDVYESFDYHPGHGIDEDPSDDERPPAQTSITAPVDSAGGPPDDRSAADPRKVYTMIEKQMSNSSDNWKKQHHYNREIQRSVKDMAESCDKIRPLEDTVLKLQAEVARLQGLVEQQGVSAEGPDNRRKIRTRRSPQ
ncbi:hypothetical protein N7468_009878 [Penicillium chermesinum]|uniref:Uncharacterized protein n=1 Tax=Penicillium chermesinum TaxID=63820 RepID=A0A9W9NBL9_9EURO|nr:uncharacterized protein N7468_009878 [Penicillium chermesinum]KAJ5216870.1 hypothetical protein N7468_009878 [Penicillium chermesinum]